MFNLFRRRRFDSLSEALAAPKCLGLRLWVNEQTQYVGAQLLQLPHLKELHLQGEGSIFDYRNFTLPLEIGQLRKLQRLTLLNLPIDFPEWIINLTDLRYLMVRGTDATQIPDWINQLQKLHTLYVENCDLQALPETLRQMDSLRHLSFVHTQLFPKIQSEQLPKHLESLNLLDSGGHYQRAELWQLKRVLGSVRLNPNPDKAQH